MMLSAILTMLFVGVASALEEISKGFLLTFGALYAIKYYAPKFNISLRDGFGNLIKIKFLD